VSATSTGIRATAPRVRCLSRTRDPGRGATPNPVAQFPSLECLVQPEVRMDSFDPRWSDDVRGDERHRGGDGPAIGREVPRGGGGSGGQDRELSRSA
jgi:hypothetical protein